MGPSPGSLPSQITLVLQWWDSGTAINLPATTIKLESATLDSFVIRIMEKCPTFIDLSWVSVGCIEFRQNFIHQLMTCHASRDDSHGILDLAQSMPSRLQTWLDTVVCAM
ncbi:hypothetical protein RRG08_020712 [Elysia crispata]|uniref:Uncharacterized protein n=1 Tax=Elysia crispata TaxID=231223 RepID=A0AAE1B1U3_9GAST|nr:hypothetical protein RRG08_020712 [Elysia crispata]